MTRMEGCPSAHGENHSPFFALPQCTTKKDGIKNDCQNNRFTGSRGAGGEGGSGPTPPNPWGKKEDTDLVKRVPVRAGSTKDEGA